MSVSQEQLAAAGQTAAAYIEKKWGGPTRLIPISGITLTSLAQRIFQNNPRRMLWFIQNGGTGNAYLDFTGVLNATTSIFLPPLGGSVEMLVDEDGESVTQEIWGAVTGANSPIGGFEVIRK